MKLTALAKDLQETQAFFQLLNEANVANVKEPIGSNITILSYLKGFADGISMPEIKNAFIKKISTFLMNDERTLHALREVPDNAPDWAKTAARTGQLMIFKPDEALNDKLQHIVHYLAAAEQDFQQTANNDQKVFAHRELQGFPKAENLDLLVKKSNEYFTRGSRNQKREASGMEQTFDAGDGFVWYELKTAEAYQREGKLLQNCIGSHYTPAKAEREHMIIFVLRDGKDNSVAAARVKQVSGAWELQEVKGKQNKPPIDKYMKPTIKFLNKMKFIIGSGSKNDLANAGYFYVNNEFYDLPTAIKKFTQAKIIDKLSNNGTVNRVTGETEIMSKAYPYSNDAVVYEARDAEGNPLFCFYVKNHILERVKSSKAVSGDENSWHYRNETMTGDIDSTLRNEMFTVLMNKDLVTDMNTNIRKQLFWNEKSVYDTKKKKFDKVQVDKEHQLSPEENKWDEYNSPGVVQEIHKVLSSNNLGFNHEYQLSDKDIKQIYVMHANKDQKFVFAVTRQGLAVPGVVTKGEFRRDVGDFGLEGDYRKTQRIDKDIRSLVSFANDKHLEIPKDIRKTQGIIQQKKDTYSLFTPQAKEIMSEPKVTQYTFGDLKGENKTTAIYRTMDDLDLKNPENRYFRHPVFGSRYRSEDEKDSPPGDVDSIYRIDITYGVDKPHKVVFSVKDNTITHFDNETKEQKWQNWDDFEKVAKIVNNVKSKLRLTLNPSSTSGSNEFQVVNGELSTKSHKIKQRLERRKAKNEQSRETTDELPYEDGSKLVRISSGEQAGWMRQQLGSSNIKGEVWKLVKSDGTIPYAYFVDNGKITRVLKHYNAQRVAAGGMPTDKSYNQESLKYLKSAADTFGWKSVMPTLTITPNDADISYRDLKKLQTATVGGQQRSYVIHDISKEPAMQRLIRFGLAKRIVTQDEDDFSHAIRARTTQAGDEALNKLRAGETIDGLSHIIGKPINPEFKLPQREVQAEQPQQGRAKPERAQGGQTKAAMAVEKFNELRQLHGRIPTLSEFKAVLTQAPFNMSQLAAQTYYYATKKRLAAPVGESFYQLNFSAGNLPLLRQVAESARK